MSGIEIWLPLILVFILLAIQFLYAWHLSEELFFILALLPQRCR